MKALICLHGLLSTKADFNYISQVLKDEYDTIVTFDLPGHGENTESFSTKNVKKILVETYDSLQSQYETIDIISFSMGGVMACYLASVRKIHRLVLLSPSYRYLNLKNYHFAKKNQTKKTNIFSVFPRKNYLHIFRFAKIMSDLSKEFNSIDAETLILWGKEDYLVKEKSGEILYSMVRNRNKILIKLDGHSHFNMLNSRTVRKIVYDFLV